MALTPIALLSQTNTTTTLILTDTTGAYNAVSNMGGYGSPNPATTNVTSVTISGTVFYPDGTTYVIPSTTLFPTGTTPVFSLNQSWILSPSTLGMTGTTFPDGIYQLTYTVNSTVSMVNYSNSYMWQQLITCNADSYIGIALAGVSCCNDDTCEIFNNFSLLQAAKAACGATMNSKALELLNTINSWAAHANFENCGCSPQSGKSFIFMLGCADGIWQPNPGNQYVFGTRYGVQPALAGSLPPNSLAFYIPNNCNIKGVSLNAGYLNTAGAANNPALVYLVKNGTQNFLIDGLVDFSQQNYTSEKIINQQCKKGDYITGLVQFGNGTAPIGMFLTLSCFCE